ncbi:MAG TPA: prepilin-type N-terminal cleavage/methylation domain-containing protein [Planctomycetota bacterium]|nr:prepilin-type N-terminal cleavage/methylation domain-containing protein [Planctomycetota bacterium]
MRPRHGTLGFTLVEVIIAIAIVAIGLVGLLALLGSSLSTAGAVMEDSFAATLARSVYDSLRQSARKRAFLVQDQNANFNFVRGFVFVHDGVLENASNLSSSPNPPLIPTKWEERVPPNAGGTLVNDLDGIPVQTKLDALRASDFSIFLPAYIPASGGGTPTGPGGSLANEDTFVFPRPNGAAADNAPTPTDPGGKTNFLSTPKPGFSAPIYFDVQRTYQLSATTTPNATVPELSTQYSFAVAISRSSVPPLVDPTGLALPWTNASGAVSTSAFPPGSALNSPNGAITRTQRTDGIYQVEVWVYRNFDPVTTSRYHEPVHGGRLIGLLAVGP